MRMRGHAFEAFQHLVTFDPQALLLGVKPRDYCAPDRVRVQHNARMTRVDYGQCNAVLADGVPVPCITAPRALTRKNWSAVRSALSTPVGVIVRVSGSRLTTALKFPLVPNAQPRERQLRPSSAKRVSTLRSSRTEFLPFLRDNLREVLIAQM